MNKFYDLYMQNKVKIEDLDDFLEEWNRGSSNEAINEYLGLTEEQYYKWVDDPRKLENELDLIKNHQLVTVSSCNKQKRRLANKLIKLAKEILQNN